MHFSSSVACQTSQESLLPEPAWVKTFASSLSLSAVCSGFFSNSVSKVIVMFLEHACVSDEKKRVKMWEEANVWDLKKKMLEDFKNNPLLHRFDPSVRFSHRYTLSVLQRKQAHFWLSSIGT